MKYDYKNFARKAQYLLGQNEGSVRLYHHSHICALLSVAIGFTSVNYAHRLELRKEFFLPNGNRKKLEPLDKHGLMALDMDYILSAVWSPDLASGWQVELWTNDREDPDWLRFVAECPNAYLIAEYPSRMGPYNIQHWIFAQKDPRRASNTLSNVTFTQETNDERTEEAVAAVQE